MTPSAKRPAAPKAPRPHFASAAIVVSDRTKALAWYTRTFGLDALDQEDHWVTVGRKGDPARLHLCQTTEYDPKGQLEPGNSGLLFRLKGKNFKASCAALKARGVAFAQEPRQDPWGWWAMVRDPDGNEHCVMPAP